MPGPNRSRPATAAVVVALLIVYVVWGSTYLTPAPEAARLEPE